MTEGAGQLRRLAALAETELRATRARPRRVVLAGVDSLTASERRVAELAAQGMTNREIARARARTKRPGHPYARTEVIRPGSDHMHADSHARDGTP